MRCPLRRLAGVVLGLAAASVYAGVTLTTVDSAGDVGGFASLQLDGDNNPVVGYYDYTNGAMKFATFRDFSVLPPEINSALIFTGPGAFPFLTAAITWEGSASSS
jgi:hypothetical protein